MAGLPLVARYWFARPSEGALGVVRHAYARNFFRAVSPLDRRRAFLALLAWPVILAKSMAKFSWRNGPIIARRHGRPVILQLLDQLRCYFRHGILPRWYYIFSLYEKGPRGKAHCFLNRFETKLATFRLLNWPGASPLNDKLAFADHCRAHAIPCIGTIAVVDEGRIEWREAPGLPLADLFIKPLAARGGRGAERWDHGPDGCFGNVAGERLSGGQLVARLLANGPANPRLVQLRQVNHPAIADLSNGALCTVRVMSCLDEIGAPEVIAAVFRMAVGGNVTVDNIHAGGIAAAVGLKDGKLGWASNLGDDARLGWMDRHPDSNAPISGRTLPCWDAVLSLAERAHRAFDDRTIVGWDIAITPVGPLLVEGNGGPDVDLLQRPMRSGLGCGRLGELMAFHLVRRGHAADFRQSGGKNIN